VRATGAARPPCRPPSSRADRSARVSARTARFAELVRYVRVCTVAVP
jgi:hypothetical protein